MLCGIGIDQNNRKGKMCCIKVSHWAIFVVWVLLVHFSVRTQHLSLVRNAFSKLVATVPPLRFSFATNERTKKEVSSVYSTTVRFCNDQYVFIFVLIKLCCFYAISFYLYYFKIMLWMILSVCVFLFCFVF